MKNGFAAAQVGRRLFLARLGGLACLGCAGLFGRQEVPPAPARLKFDEDAGLSIREALKLGTLPLYVPLMQRFAVRFGKSKFQQMLQEETRGLWTDRMKQLMADVQKKDLAEFFATYSRASLVASGLNDPALFGRLMESASTVEVIQQTDRILEVKVTECLFAQVYRKAGAWDIGYISHCYPDYVAAEAFDPQMKLFRNRTLMRGDNHCNHRWSWGG